LQKDTYIRDKETTLHEQPRRVSNLAQGFIIRWRINENACSNQRHIIFSSGDGHKSDTPNIETKFHSLFSLGLSKQSHHSGLEDGEPKKKKVKR